MKVTYKMSLADHKAAYRMYRRRTFFFRYDQFIWPSVAVLCLAVFFSLNYRSEVAQQFAVLFCLSLWFSIGLPIFRAFKAYRCYRASLNEKRLSPEFSTEITAERIADVTPGICEHTYTWPSIIGFGQDDRITLFRTSGEHILFFPTSSLSVDHCAELNELISQHGIRRWS